MTPVPAPTAQPSSPAQRLRLESECRGVLRAFAYHPRVEVTPLAGAGDEAPVEYQLHFKVTTLAVNEVGELAWVTAVPVHLWLPPHFPHEPPVIRPMVPVFHPNVTMEWVHLNPPWQPQASLVEVVTQVGQVLAFQAYDPGVVINPVAMDWVYANPSHVPTDPAADFTPDAGGGPLVRLLRFGPAALAEARRQTEAMLDRALSAATAPPPQEELADLAHRVRLTTLRFSGDDVPELLRDAADDIEEALESVVRPDTVWEQLKRYAAGAKVLAGAVADIVRAEEGLWKATAALDAAAPAGEARHAERAVDPLADVPSLATVQPLGLGLRRAVRDAEHAVDSLRSGLGALAAPPRLPTVRPGGMLARRLEREAARASERGEPARASGGALASLEPVLQRARREALVVDRVVAWADYADLMTRGDQLARQLISAGPGAIQSYQVRVGGDTAGPFHYEQRVQVGDLALAVSNRRGRAVRVVDANTEEPLGAGEGDVPLAAGGPVVYPADHTDELRVRFEYLLTQTREALGRLAEPLDPEQYDREGSWAGRLAAALDVPAARERINADHQRKREEWKALVADLAALGRLRQRQAICHLLARLEDFAPRVVSEVERLRQTVERAGQRLGEIASRSQRDLETDQLIIPQALAREYAERLAERDAAAGRIVRLRAALDRLAARAGSRLSKPARVGSAAIPKFQALPPLPGPEEELARRMDDRSMSETIARLEKLLGTPLSEPVRRQSGGLRGTSDGVPGEGGGGGGGPIS